MIVSGFWSIFLVGCFGGLMGEALNWYSLRNSPRIAAYRTKVRYWLTTVVMILIGGVLAALYGIEDRSAILVAHIGLTTPLIIKALAQIPPQGSTKDLNKAPSILDFIAGR